MTKGSPFRRSDLLTGIIRIRERPSGGFAPFPVFVHHASRNRRSELQLNYRVVNLNKHRSGKVTFLHEPVQRSRHKQIERPSHDDSYNNPRQPSLFHMERFKCRNVNVTKGELVNLLPTAGSALRNHVTIQA